MAQTILSLNREALLVHCVLWVASVLLLNQKADGFQFKVGGSTSSWMVPSDPNSAVYNQWAEKNRFQIGDSLLFVYDGNKDSVLHVTKDDYTNCNTAAPLHKYSDGHTVFKLDQSGPYYFISGEAENCRKNEKLVVVVMADRSHRNSSGAPPSENPSPPKNGASSTAIGVAGVLVVFLVHLLF